MESVGEQFNIQTADAQSDHWLDRTAACPCLGYLWIIDQPLEEEVR